MSAPTRKTSGGSASRRHTGAPTNNLAKAMLEAGGHTVQSTIDSGVQMMGDALGSLFGASGGSMPQQSQNDTPENMNQPDGMFDSFSQQEQQETEWHDMQMAMSRHREVQQTEVFDARKVETERKIDQILEELKALSKDLDNAGREAKEAQIAVMQGAVNPGEYHVSFFQHLLKVIMMLRQRVKESTNWLQQFNSRKSAQKGYWGQFYKNGTQWSMSSERSIATSVG